MHTVKTEILSGNQISTIIQDQNNVVIPQNGMYPVLKSMQERPSLNNSPPSYLEHMTMTNRTQFDNQVFELTPVLDLNPNDISITPPTFENESSPQLTSNSTILDERSGVTFSNQFPPVPLSVLPFSIYSPPKQPASNQTTPEKTPVLGY